MATHSSILPGKILWTDKPSGLQFMGTQRIGHDLATKQQPHGSQFPFSGSGFLLFLCFWLHWVFVAAHRLSLVAVSGAAL